MKREYCIITTTIDDKKITQLLINRLLEKRLVACAQTHIIKSHYHWQGKIEEASEIIISFKTKRSFFKSIEAEIISLHSYELPEIIMVPILDGSDSYLAWIDANVKKDKR